MNKKIKVSSWCLFNFLLVVNHISNFTHKINNEYFYKTHYVLNKHLVKFKYLDNCVKKSTSFNTFLAGCVLNQLIIS